MKFSISKIEIENFRSFRSKAIICIKPGLWSIEGANGDEATANGSGKSSIISALYWALTGNALTNETLADDIVNVQSGKNCKVTVFIDSDQGEIKITRTRKDSELGNNLVLEVGSQNLSCHKVADTQDRINQLFKIPFELLHSTIMMTHDIKSAFSELTPQLRVQTLESIRDYSIWDKVRDEANKDIKTYNKEIQELKLALSKIEGSYDTYMKMLNTSKSELENITKTFDIAVLGAKIAELKNASDTMSKKLVELKEQSQQYEKQLIDQEDNTIQKQLNVIVDDANNLKLKSQQSEYVKLDIKKEIDIIDSWFKNDRCPTCGHLLSRSDQDKALKLSQRDELCKKLSDVESEIAKLGTEVTAKRAQWSELNSKLQKSEENKKVLRTNFSECNKSIESIQADINRNTNLISQMKAERDTHQAKLDKINADITNYTQELAKMTDSQKELQSKIDTFESKRQLSDYFYKLLGSKGELRPYLLMKDIAYLNRCISKYMSVFFKNTDAQLVLNGPTIDIVINSNGIQKKVSSLSGGEKKRLNIAIQLSLYDLIKSTSQVSFNTLWLDEIESELDSVGVQQLIDVIDDKSNEIDTVFWITNHPAVSESIPNKIICKKSLGVTTIEER